jgi:hypothetical protein
MHVKQPSKRPVYYGADGHPGRLRFYQTALAYNPFAGGANVGVSRQEG